MLPLVLLRPAPPDDVLFVSSVRLLKLLLLPPPDPNPLEVVDPAPEDEDDENEWSKYDRKGDGDDVEPDDVGGLPPGDGAAPGCPEPKWFHKAGPGFGGVSGAKQTKYHLDLHLSHIPPYRSDKNNLLNGL